MPDMQHSQVGLGTSYLAAELLFMSSMLLSACLIYVAPAQASKRNGAFNSALPVCVSTASTKLAAVPSGLHSVRHTSACEL